MSIQELPDAREPTGVDKVYQAFTAWVMRKGLDGHGYVFVLLALRNLKLRKRPYTQNRTHIPCAERRQTDIPDVLHLVRRES